MIAGWCPLTPKSLSLLRLDLFSIRNDLPSPLLYFMLHDMSDYGFEQFDFLIKRGLGDGHSVVEVSFFVLRTS